MVFIHNRCPHCDNEGWELPDDTNLIKCETENCRVNTYEQYHA